MDDALDIEDAGALIAYLRAAGRLGRDETPEVRVLAGGVSNRTVWLRRPGGDAWVLKQALAKLRVAVDWFSSPARIEREAAGMRVLEALLGGEAIAPLVFEDRERHLLAMRAIPEPHESWKAILLAGRIEAAHVRGFGGRLGAIHRRAFEARATLPAELEDRSFFESLRIEPYYLYAAERVPTAAGFLTALVGETRAARLTLVHGDYSPKNVLVRGDGGAMVLLDHEVVHVGDQAFDVGFALAHLLSKAHHLAALRKPFAAAADAAWAAYREALGPIEWRDLEPRAVRHTLGCLLARVDGRSPLEYLDARARAAQRAAVLALCSRPPARVPELVEAFVRRLDPA